MEGDPVIDEREAETAGESLTLRSSAFEHDGEIPERHNCDGEDLSPHLAWGGAPEGAQTSP